MNFRFIEDLVNQGIVIVILAIVLAIIVAIGLFFLFRAITCWYFKINKLLKTLKTTNSNLERIAIAVEQNNLIISQQSAHAASPAVSTVAAPTPAAVPTPVAAPTPAVAPTMAETPAFVTESVPVARPERKCASCGSTLKEGTLFCVNCGAKVEPEA